MKPRFKYNFGFSLIEMMITLAIFLIISSAVFLTLATGRTYWYSGKTQLEVQQEARRGLNYMVGELRQSASSKISFTGVADASGFYNNITFKIPQDTTGDGNVATNGIPEWSGNITYSSSSNQLIRTPSKAVGKTFDVLANNISELKFKSSGNIIEIKLTSQKQTTQNYPVSTALAIQLKLRN